MAARRSSKAKSPALLAAEISMAAPQVVAERLGRMAQHGFNPSARDRKELYTMSAEKVAAFSQSWTAMFGEMFRIQQRMLGAAFTPFAWPPRAPSGATLARSASSVLGKGLAPVHSNVVANAKRLKGRK
jgi:hypothetical protein